jgi:type I restriction enzyme, S subunit
VNVVEFGTLFHFIRNGMNVKQDKSGDGLPITRIETISEATVDAARVGYANLNESDCHDWLMKEGDILFSHINSVEHVGKCAVYRGTPEKLVHGMNLLCMRCDSSKLLPEFAKYLIRGPEFRTRLSNFINKAVNQASVSIGNLKTIQVRVPALAEQQRISEVLDRAEELRAKRRATLTQLDTLTQSIFLDLFGDPLAENGKHKHVKFESVTRRITYGFTSPMKHLDDGIPIITAKNVWDGFIDFESVHYANQSEFDALTAKSKPELGDVLITKDGTIGRCAVVERNTPFCINQSVALVQPAHDQVRPSYMVAYLSTNRVQNVMKNMGKGNALAHLQITELADMTMPLPPVSLQDDFARRCAGAPN